MTVVTALSWDDPAFLVSSDTPWRARYRALQSWYRETILHLQPGLDRRGRARGNLLPAEAVRANPGLNFLTPEIAGYADARVPEVRAVSGTLEEDRLRRNMLSSMPLCFNVFGYLRAHPVPAARVLSRALSLDIASITAIEVEWMPPGEHPLDDRTAFDAFVEYRTSSGLWGFLGVETKYTEPFSPKRYDCPRYRQLTEAAVSGFRAGASTRLVRRATNQLWRNALLAVAVRAQGGYDFGHAVVLAPEGDKDAQAAVAGLRAELEQPDRLLAAASLEALVGAAESEPLLAGWARAFRTRYLDLSPVHGTASAEAGSHGNPPSPS